MDHFFRELGDPHNETVALGMVPHDVIKVLHDHRLPTHKWPLEDDHRLVWLQELYHFRLASAVIPQRVEKLIYSTITCPDITYTMGLLSQFMHVSHVIHWKVALRLLTYLKHAPRRGLLHLQHGFLCVEAYSSSSYAIDRDD